MENITKIISKKALLAVVVVLVLVVAVFINQNRKLSNVIDNTDLFNPPTQNTSGQPVTTPKTTTATTKTTTTSKVTTPKTSPKPIVVQNGNSNFPAPTPSSYIVYPVPSASLALKAYINYQIGFGISAPIVSVITESSTGANFKNIPFVSATAAPNDNAKKSMDVIVTPGKCPIVYNLTHSMLDYLPVDSGVWDNTPSPSGTWTITKPYYIAWKDQCYQIYLHIGANISSGRVQQGSESVNYDISREKFHLEGLFATFKVTK